MNAPIDIAKNVMANKPMFPPIVGIGRYSDAKQRGLLVTFDRRLTDEEVEQARNALAAPTAQMQEPFAYVVYAINGSGKHYIDAIKEVADAEDGEWSIDDNCNGERWAGNTALFRSPVQLVAAPPAYEEGVSGGAAPHNAAGAEFSDEKRAVIMEAAQVLESAAKHNQGEGRTVLAHIQQHRADRLRAVVAAKAAS